MTKILTILPAAAIMVLINYKAYSQNCNGITEAVTDKVSSETLIKPAHPLALTDVSIPEDGVLADIVIAGRGTTMVLTLQKTGLPIVVDEDSEIIFFFSDGTKAVTNSQSAKFNATGQWTIFFTAEDNGVFKTKELGQQLRNKVIKSVTLSGYSQGLAITPSVEEAKAFHETFICMWENLLKGQKDKHNGSNGKYFE